MRYGRDNFYRIEDFSPLIGGMGGHGFFIKLNPEYAKAFYEKEVSETAYNRIQEIGKEIIFKSNLAKENKLIRNPFFFMENEEGNSTMLLRIVSVPGDACSLGIQGTELGLIRNFFRGEKELLKGYIEYAPHNVDSILQSYTLLSCWLYWAKGAEASAISLD